MTTVCAALLRGLALAGLLAGASAWGQVRLETDVSKVETTLDAGGEVQRTLVPAEEVVPGEELRYSITFHNDSDTPVDAERIVITNPIPDGTVYVLGSAGGEHAAVAYSTDGESFQDTEPADDGGALAPEGAEPKPQNPTSQAVESLRWTYQRELEPGENGEVFFHVRMQ